MTTFTKLKSGSWGLRVVGPAPVAGSRVEVEKRDGSRSSVTVARVIWSAPDGQTHLCAIVDERAQAAPARSDPGPWSSQQRANQHRCAECGSAPGVVECSDSSGIRGLCCRRCASGASYERSFA